LCKKERKKVNRVAWETTSGDDHRNAANAYVVVGWLVGLKLFPRRKAE
jgi:hypothetical protein